MVDLLDDVMGLLRLVLRARVVMIFAGRQLFWQRKVNQV